MTRPGRVPHAERVEVPRQGRREPPPLSPEDRRQRAIFDEPGAANQSSTAADVPAAEADIDRRVQAALRDLTPDQRLQMQAVGRRLCDHIAEQAQARRDLKEASVAVSQEMGHGRPLTPAMRLAMLRATPGRLVEQPDGTWRAAGRTGRADTVDERMLARELGRDRLQRMLAVLDEDDAGQAPAECGAVDDGPAWAAPERCARTPHGRDDQHRSRAGSEWSDDEQDPASPPPRPEPDGARSDDYVQEHVR